MKKLLPLQPVISLVLSLVFLALFAGFSALVKQDFFVKFDFDALVKIQDRIPRVLDGFFHFWSFLARFEIMAGAWVLLFLFRRKLAHVFILALFLFAHLVEYVGKEALHQPGPPYLFYRGGGVEFFRDYVNPGYSYPSGHAMRSVYFAAVAGYFILQSRLRVYKKAALVSGVFLFAFFVLTGKLALGQHWPTDVAGGAMLAGSMALVAIFFLEKHRR